MRCCGVDLVVTDLDGSLWHGAGEVHPATRAAWSELTQRGVPVLVATGRRITSTREPLARLGLAPPAVVLNGAIALDLATGERFHRHSFEVTAAERVLEAFLTVGVEPCVYVEHGVVDVFVSPCPSTHARHVESFGALHDVGDLAEVVRSVPVLGFGVLGYRREPLEQIEGALAGIGEAHLGVDKLYGNHALTVAPAGLSKWDGVRAFCKRAGLSAERVLVVGDGPNDLELLSHAAIAVVPEDGYVDALALADHIVGSPSVGGWSGILDLI
jgi:hydroxymethylpyrimidine pyrophosphatase-like HAD family hydrolase